MVIMAPVFRIKMDSAQWNKIESLEINFRDMSLDNFQKGCQEYLVGKDITVIKRQSQRNNYHMISLT